VVHLAGVFQIDAVVPWAKGFCSELFRVFPFGGNRGKDALALSHWGAVVVGHA